MADSRDDLLQQSYKLAEQALEWVRKRELPATPDHFTLGYEYNQDPESDVGHQISRLEGKGTQIEQQAQVLYQQFFGHDNGDHLNEFRTALNAIMEQALKATSGTRSGLSHYHEHLTNTSEQLTHDPSDLKLVQSVVEGLINQTEEMSSTVKTLETDLTHATGEIDQLKQQYDQIRDEIFADPLTGVLNRRGLDSAINRVLSDTQSTANHALLMLDLDNFKPLNDQYGHIVGDQVLCFIAKTLKNIVRGADSVGRYGGDEFAVLLPETDIGGATKVAENIVDALRKSQLKRRSTGQLLGKITASVGVALAQEDDTNETLFDRADKALYRAKQSGKDSVVSAT